MLINSFIDMDNDLIEFYAEGNQIIVKLTVKMPNSNLASFAGANPFAAEMPDTNLTRVLKEEGIEAVKRAINYYKQDRFYRNKKDKIEMIKPYIIKL